MVLPIIRQGTKQEDYVVKLRGILLGIVFAAVAVGFAAAMPGAMRASDVGPDEHAAANAQTPKPDKTKEPKPEKTEAEDTEEEAETENGSEDNHGAVVSAVAKCDVKGRWHGEAVRSIAQNKDATLADAEAACAAAQAAAAAAGDTHGKSAAAKAKSHGKPDDAGNADAPKPPKAPKPKPTQAAAPETSEQDPPPTDPGPPPGKGNDKKP